MKSLGRHILLELYDCNRELINKLEPIKYFLLESARLSGAEIIKYDFHSFEPQGISGMIIIAESHFSIHTWPEYGYCAIDIFTCGEKINNEIAVKYLKENLQSKNISIIEMKRGILNLPESEIKYKGEIK